MTAVATATHHPPRTFAATRLHVANPWPVLITPWLITIGIFGANVAIWYIVSSSATGPLDDRAFANSGGIFWIVVYMLVAAVQAMSTTFRFAMGLSLTRREYFLGTIAFFGGVVVLYSVGLTALAAIERATGGWGVDGYFFAPFGFQTTPMGVIGYTYLVAFLLSFSIGSVFATVWTRWQARGLVMVFLALTVVLVVVVWLLTYFESWTAIGEFFTQTSHMALATWTLPVSLVMTLLAFALMRRAVPRG